MLKLHRVQVPVLAPGTLARVRKHEDEPFRILHVSDFRMLPNQKLRWKWITSLDALNPDLVIGTSDSLGGDKAVPSVLAALGPLLSRPGAFVSGTDDCFASRPVSPLKYLMGKKRRLSRVEPPWRRMCAASIEHGWQDATHAQLEFVAGGVKVALSGVGGPHHELENYSQIAGAPNADADIAIGLSHSPGPHVLDAFAEDDYDLVLSGHTYGGQVCLSEGETIVTNCDIDRSQTSRLSRWTKKTWLHVSNGLGTSPCALMHLFYRPSTILIKIMEQDSQFVIRRGAVRSL